MATGNSWMQRLKSPKTEYFYASDAYSREMNHSVKSQIFQLAGVLGASELIGHGNVGRIRQMRKTKMPTGLEESAYCRAHSRHRRPGSLVGELTANPSFKRTGLRPAA
jgi:hypothetical protein